MHRSLLAPLVAVALLAGCQITTVLDEDDVGSRFFGGLLDVDALPGGGFVAYECTFESAWGGQGVMVVEPGEALRRRPGCSGPSSIEVGPDGTIYRAEDGDPASQLPPSHGVWALDPETLAATVAFDSLSPEDTWERMGHVGVAPDGALHVGMRDLGSATTRIHRVTGPTTSVPVPGTEGLGDRPFLVGADGAITAISGHRVVRVDPATGATTVVAGTGTAGSTGDGGPAAQARLARPVDLARQPGGALLIAEAGLAVDEGRVRQVGIDGRIRTIAGGGTDRDDGGLATDALLVGVSGVAVGADGCVYVSEGRSSFLEPDRPGGVVRQVGLGCDLSAGARPARAARK